MPNSLEYWYTSLQNRKIRFLIAPENISTVLTNKNKFLFLLLLWNLLTFDHVMLYHALIAVCCLERFHNRKLPNLVTNFGLTISVSEEEIWVKNVRALICLPNLFGGMLSLAKQVSWLTTLCILISPTSGQSEECVIYEDSLTPLYVGEYDPDQLSYQVCTTWLDMMMTTSP